MHRCDIVAWTEELTRLLIAELGSDCDMVLSRNITAVSAEAIAGAHIPISDSLIMA